MFSILGLEKDHIIIKITDWFPLIAAREYSATDNISAIFTMLAWIVAAGIFVVVCFMKTSKDR